MTNAQQTPAGWYPDATVQGQLRWWDGVQWTDRVQAPYAAGSAAFASGQSVGVATGTWQVWAINGLFALQMAVSLGYLATIDWGAYMAFSMDPTPGDPGPLLAMFNAGYFATLFVSFIGYFGTVLLAFLDSKELARRGVERPFHWAWNFIPSYGSMVYIIGRTVVVKRRTGGGLAPLWAYIIIFVLGVVASLVVVVAMMNSMFAAIPDYVPS